MITVLDAALVNVEMKSVSVTVAVWAFRSTAIAFVVETVETFAVVLHVSVVFTRVVAFIVLPVKVLKFTVLSVAVLTVSVLTRSVEKVPARAVILDMFMMILLAVVPISVEMKMVSVTVAVWDFRSTAVVFVVETVEIFAAVLQVSAVVNRELSVMVEPAEVL